MNENLKSAFKELSENIQIQINEMKKTNRLISDAWDSDSSDIFKERADKIVRGLSEIHDDLNSIK